MKQKNYSNIYSMAKNICNYSEQDETFTVEFVRMDFYIVITKVLNNYEYL